MILDIVSPEGEKLTFAYTSFTYCTESLRLDLRDNRQGLSRHFGYQQLRLPVDTSAMLDYFYDPTDPYNLPIFAFWAGVIGVSARNLAVSTSTVIASQSFGYLSSGGITNYNVTDAERRVTNTALPAVLSSASPIPATPTRTSRSAIAAALVILALRGQGAGTTTYGRSDSGNIRTVTVTPPPNSAYVRDCLYLRYR